MTIQCILKKSDIDGIRQAFSQVNSPDIFYRFYLGEILIGTISESSDTSISYENLYDFVYICTEYNKFSAHQMRKTDTCNEYGRFSSFSEAEQFILSIIPEQCREYVTIVKTAHE